MENKCEAVIFIESMNRLGGTEIVALNLKNALCAAEMQTIILSMEEYAGNDTDIVSVDNTDKTKYGIRPRSFSDKLFPKRQDNAVKRFLSDFCDKHHVKALINFTYENLSVLPTGMDCKTIVVYHWSVSGYEQSLLKIIDRKSFPARLISNYVIGRQYDRLHRLIGQTDYAVALTEGGKEELERIAPKANVKVIPNFLPYNEPAKAIASGKNRRAVFVGRLSREKGVYHLLDIWQKVARQLPDVELDIYGEGNERSAMAGEINEKNIPRINFKGFEPKPENIYLNADLLLCTSETEGFGMVLIEAMYFGVVPIAFDCPVSPKELIADAGMMIDCFDTAQYANTVISLFNSSDSMTAFRNKGLERASQFYKNKIISKWQQLIR